MASVNQAETYWNAGQFFNCGEALGDALVLACGDHSTFINNKEVIRRQIENNRKKENIPDNVKMILSLL